jgi:nuclear pore complex protein Nup62
VASDEMKLRETNDESMFGHLINKAVKNGKSSYHSYKSKDLAQIVYSGLIIALCIFTYMCFYVYICIYVCMHVCIHVRMYLHVYMKSGNALYNSYKSKDLAQIVYSGLIVFTYVCIYIHICI